EAVERRWRRVTRGYRDRRATVITPAGPPALRHGRKWVWMAGRTHSRASRGGPTVPSNFTDSDSRVEMPHHGSWSHGDNRGTEGYVGATSPTREKRARDTDGLSGRSRLW